jgi:hypothetical protein
MSGVTVSIPLVAKLEKASSQQAIDTLARTIAQMLLGDMRERIHEQGRKRMVISWGLIVSRT